MLQVPSTLVEAVDRLVASLPLKSEVVSISPVLGDYNYRLESTRLAFGAITLSSISQAGVSYQNQLADEWSLNGHRPRH